MCSQTYISRIVNQITQLPNTPSFKTGIGVYGHKSTVFLVYNDHIIEYDFYLLLSCTLYNHVNYSYILFYLYTRIELYDDIVNEIKGHW